MPPCSIRCALYLLEPNLGLHDLQTLVLVSISWNGCFDVVYASMRYRRMCDTGGARSSARRDGKRRDAIFEREKDATLRGGGMLASFQPFSTIDPLTYLSRRSQCPAFQHPFTAITERSEQEHRYIVSCVPIRQQNLVCCNLGPRSVLQL